MANRVAPWAVHRVAPRAANVVVHGEAQRVALKMMEVPGVAARAAEAIQVAATVAKRAGARVAKRVAPKVVPRER